MDSKRCPDCGATKPVSQFGRNRSLRDGLSFYCLECNRARSNAHYRERQAASGRKVRDHSWIPDGFRWCPSCEQPVAHEDYTRSGLTASGFGGRCKACHSAYNSEAYFYRKYRLTKNQVAQLRSRQGDRCAICGEAGPEHLDHDHETGELRQFLCQRCNHGLGLFRDDPTLLHSAAFYVQGHRERQALAVVQAQSDAARSPDQPGELQAGEQEYAADGAGSAPPVGSGAGQDRPRNDCVTGRTNGSRRREPAGEE